MESENEFNSHSLPRTVSSHGTLVEDDNESPFLCKYHGYQTKKKVSIKSLANALKGMLSKTKSSFKFREEVPEPFNFPNAFMMGLIVGDKEPETRRLAAM